MKLEETLNREGWLVYRIKGVSMLPMLRQEKDLVVIEKPKGRLEKYDVALYKRGEDYVLHRVIGLRDDGYIIRGDNTYALEMVPEEDVIGVLTAFIRNGKKTQADDVRYRLYVRFWCAAYPAITQFRRFSRGVRGVARRLGITPVIKKILRWG